MFKRFAYVLCSIAALWSHAALSNETRKVTVSASHTLEAAPDIATIQVTAFGEAPTLDAAKKKADAKLQDIRTVSLEHEIEEHRLTTTSISIQPQYHYSEEDARQLTGFHASYHVNIVVTDIAQIGSLLESYVAKGIDRVGQVEYALKNPDRLTLEALEQAVDKAHKKAQSIAQAANVALSDPINIQENAQHSLVRRTYHASRMADAEMSVAPPTGKLDVKAGVTVTYGLQ